jgi:hypothetical protein
MCRLAPPRSLQIMICRSRLAAINVPPGKSGDATFSLTRADLVAATRNPLIAHYPS